MNKKDKHSKTDESTLFREAVGPVDPVNSRRKQPRPPQPKPHAKFSKADDRAVLAESLHGDFDIAEVETGEELVFARPDISNKILKQLRRGHYSIQDEIDLHGMTLAEARPALHEFLRECLADRCHCVRVVHGKGHGSGPRGPVLKNAVNRWLRRWDAVAAFCSAQPYHGGTGAAYVLLRKYHK
ncbi:MAG: Smr/MutS family protein [Gammaproteobacteria bacterium]|nr:Smr/MutS family protein [Gammaproteobacteria bacterium]